MLKYITDEQRDLAGFVESLEDSDTFSVGNDLQGADIRILNTVEVTEEEVVGDCCEDLGVCEGNLAVCRGENGELQDEIDDLEDEIEELGPEDSASFSYTITSTATADNPSFDEGFQSISTFFGSVRIYNGWDGNVYADATHGTTNDGFDGAIASGPGLRLYNRTDDTFKTMINSSPTTQFKPQIPGNQYAVTTIYKVKESSDDWIRVGDGPAVHTSIATWAAGVVATPPQL